MPDVVTRAACAIALSAVGASILAPGRVAAQPRPPPWAEVLRVAPCVAVPVRVDGAMLTACGGRFDLNNLQYVRTPYEAIATVGDLALVAPDEERRGGGLALDRTPSGAEPALGERVSRVEGSGATSWALSPDGRRVATMELSHCNEEGVCTTEVVERSLPELRQVSRTRLARQPTALAYVPRGLAVVEGATVRLVSGTVVARLPELPRADPLVALSADGLLVAYLARDHTLRVLLTDGGAMVGRTPLVVTEAERVVLSASGRRVAIATEAETLVIPVVLGGAVPPDRALGPVHHLPGHARELAVTDGSVLAAVTDDDELVVRAQGGQARAALGPAPQLALPSARDFEPYTDGSSERHAHRVAMLAPRGTRTGGNATASVTIEVYDGRDLAGQTGAIAWAAAAAERFGPVEYSTSATGRNRTMRVTNDDAARAEAEVEGFGNGCDPWPVWIRLQRRGDWVVRIELSYDYSLARDPRVAQWQRALRAVDVAAAAPAPAPARARAPARRTRRAPTR